MPAFMIASLFFYVQKRMVNKSYFRKRTVRLVQILCFWWPVYFLLTQLTSFPLVPNSLLGVFLIPFLNGACYFLGGLVFCIFCIEIIERAIEKLPQQYANLALIAFTILGFVIAIIVRNFIPHNSEILVQAIGLGPLAFLIYPASMVVFAHWTKAKSITTLLGMGIVFQIIEVCRIAQMSGVNSSNVLDILQLNYGSPVIVPIALVIVLMFESLKIEKLNAFTRWVATYALGIYLVHPIVIAGANRLTHDQFLFMFAKTINVSSGTIGINPFSISAVMAASFVIVNALGKSPLKRFVC